ncbi:hypothetical protein [Pseudanabaena mucicola]|uniref:hypothetical protein n=1 Tax=Pseudanabaena mucicola TaxID=71190 RepID=UPI002574A4BB|nr:hypothetical protein [Pseudanabaena mucicola]
MLYPLLSPFVPPPSQTNCDRPRFGQSIPIDKLSVNIINPYGNALPLPEKILKNIMAKPSDRLPCIFANCHNPHRNRG